MSLPPFNVKTLQSLTHTMMLADMHYGLGSKIPLSLPSSGFNGRKVDCSGFVRYLTYHSTDPHLTIPDGSYNQLDWFHSRAPLVNYDDTIRQPHELHICFIRTLYDARGHVSRVGHVFFVREGLTYESHGGVGPNSRKWDTRILKAETGPCYKVPHIWK